MSVIPHRNMKNEITQENIQDWLQLDEGDPGFQILTEEQIAAVIFLFTSLYLLATA
jgi:hypothetical protein